MTKPKWYQNAVIYGLDIETFMDSNSDGVGDFRGAISKLNYLAELGITCIWLPPFYETQNLDNGYDVVNHINIDTRHGTFDDFIDFLKECHSRDIKVIIDLVYHHTSNQHPWFQASRIDPNSKYREYYVWRETLPDKDERVPTALPAFPGEQRDVWTYDRVAKAYYYHRFYDVEPDLNLQNPDVQNEIYKIIDYWLSLGVDGFRVDAATMVIDDKGIPGTKMKDPGSFLEKMYECVLKKNPNGVLLGEADVVRKDQPFFFGKDGKRLQLLMNFFLNAFSFLSFTDDNGEVIANTLLEQPQPPPNCAWVNFYRNLDELNITHLSSEGREAVYEVFAPHKDMRIYNRGIRRRLAPMMEGNLARLKMLYSLLYSFPGPTMFMYGDEIGMGDTLSLPGRWGVRTPMQWSTDKNAGFSHASEDKLVRPLISYGDYSYGKINVRDQVGNSESLLAHIKGLNRIKKRFPVFGLQDFEVITTGVREVFAISYPNQNLLILTNLSKETKVIKNEKLTFSNAEVILASQGIEVTSKQPLTLPGYSYVWLTGTPLT